MDRVNEIAALQAQSERAATIDSIEAAYLGMGAVAEPPPSIPPGSDNDYEPTHPQRVQEFQPHTTFPQELDNIVSLDQKGAVLDGVRVMLSDEAVKQIKTIVAREVEREVLENLAQWRAKHALCEAERNVAV
jgi:hypothetical protein